MLCEVGGHSFTVEDADIAAYAKFGFEPLPVCFPHQHQWRLAFRNDRFLHRRKCDLTGADMISMYPQGVQYKVYEREAWFSDKWDPLSYGRPFDFARSFFDQYADLQKEVPRIALVNVGSINSDFCNSAVFNKNCYLIFGGDRNEDCMFGALPMYCKNSLDCDWTTRCELCYFCGYAENCYGCQFTFNSKDCSSCFFVEDSIGCTECILSFNLRNKSYYIENKPYTKEEYQKKKIELLNSGSYAAQQTLWWRFLELRKQQVVKYSHTINAENSSGDLIFSSKNCVNCYECIGCEDCRECWTMFEAKDSFNTDYVGHGSSLNFNNLSTDTAYRTWCSYFTITSSDIEYSELTNFSKNLFGCIGVRHQEYCILNKKYSKEEFTALRGKIIEHMKKDGERTARARSELINQWGRFFPKALSTFPYNESTASFFFPLTKDQALAQGFWWRDEEVIKHEGTFQIPDTIREVPDSILQETLVCEKSGKNFRITEQELLFYRKHLIPIPRLHPDERYRERLALRNPFTLFKRECMKCGLPIQTTYTPERTEKVYCEKCYLAEVY